MLFASFRIASYSMLNSIYFRLSPIDLSRLTTDESKEPRFDKNNHDTIGEYFELLQ